MAPAQRHTCFTYSASQLATVSEDDTCHQVKMDVSDFVNRGVRVDVVDGNELVVEVSNEDEVNSSAFHHNWRRRFSFPGLQKIESMTSTMSPDGILTITVPKTFASL
ncbi:hypothetical protein OTU49_003878 [Cherax quadricarinatus]|uniref:SHSP domain-containing protein n=1 Tax=Cherax quadricarinatus TaxID=27406 RepID=A0AAW0X1P1_CHEQU|nr:heat shock protein 26-like [Cherax quadricarinatus]